MTAELPSSWPTLTTSRPVLCLGAHSDDVEIGCGGTLLRLLEANPEMEVIWVVAAIGDDDRRAEAEASARRLLGENLAEIRLMAFRERYLPYDPGLKEFFDELGSEFDPGLVFAPRTADLHQDHRTVGELAWNTFRSQPIWEYEIVKYEGDLGNPNLYVPLHLEHLEGKIEHLARAFPSQTGRYWYSEETFRALARIRGIECRSSSGYAEAFHARKVILS